MKKEANKRHRNPSRLNLNRRKTNYGSDIELHTGYSSKRTKDGGSPPKK